MLRTTGVEAMAEVILNGNYLGVLWKPPFVLEITGLTQAGPKALEVRVTDTWRNRLIGNAKYPQGFPTTGDAGEDTNAALPALARREHLRVGQRKASAERPPRTGATAEHCAHAGQVI